MILLLSKVAFWISIEAALMYMIESVELVTRLWLKAELNILINPYYKDTKNVEADYLVVS